MAATALLGVSLAAKPGSPRFYWLTLGAAGTYTAGGLTSGPIPLGRAAKPTAEGRRCLLGAVLLGIGTFVVFYVCARIAKHIPILNRAIASILGFAHHGAMPLVVLSTVTNGAAEEIFFRGAVYAAAEDDCRASVPWSTAMYGLSTIATRNPALVLASVVMGTLFAMERRASGGVFAPVVTHLVWSMLMLKFLPPMFPPDAR